jgi:ubiquinone/menaquinone biosynthesis C-methylase UbiE
MSAADHCADYAPVWAAAPASACRPGGLALTDHALALCGLPSGARLLDVGCGSAVVCAHLRGQHGLAAIGLDPAAGALQAGRRNASDLPLIQASGGALPLATQTLDLVLAECSLSLIPNPRRALAEFRRVLRPGGRLVVSDLYARADAPAGLWTEISLRDLIGGAGFAITAWEDHSPALKVFAAQWLFTHGSLPPLGYAAPAAARPGYFLLIARRS